VTESFDSFLGSLSSQAASTDAIARGVAVESYSGAQGDGPQTASDKHILTMGLKHPSRFEIGDGANDRMSYFRQPGSLSLIPTGVLPMMRAETEFDLLACALDSGLINALHSELGLPQGRVAFAATLPRPCCAAAHDASSCRCERGLFNRKPVQGASYARAGRENALPGQAD